MKQNQILNKIIEITNLSKDKKIIGLDKLLKSKKAIVIAKKFNITHEEAIIFSILFYLNYNKNYRTDISDIANHLDCETIELIPYNIYIESLKSKKLIKYEIIKINKNLKSIQINSKITYSITSNFNDKVEEPITDNISFLSKLHELMTLLIDKEICYEEADAEIIQLIEENNQIYFANRLDNLNLTHEIRIFLIYIVVMYYKGNYDIAITSALDDLFADSPKIYGHVKMQINTNKGILFEQEILKTVPCFWKNDAEVTITKAGAKYLFNEDANLILVDNDINKKHHKYVISFDTIEQKELFYNDIDLKTIDFIHDTIKEENYNSIIQRLKDNNMQQGLTILAHGKPGTGKTETVYQMAKATNRNIYKVEISNLKSMWFGESQKKIKNLFEEYYKYTEQQKTTPILFFNEADAVINKRKDSNSSNTAQTENEIQNILLQEIEDFKGILIATTNLIENIDSAFDRRFLFKLELTIPTAFVRHKIYKSLLPNLNDNELWILAEDFNFSGGVIQNIVRKATMQHVLYGDYPTLDWYIDACKQEQYKTTNSSSLIGFKK